MIKGSTTSLEQFLIDNKKNMDDTVMPIIKSETTIHSPISCKTYRSSFALSRNTSSFPPKAISNINLINLTNEMMKCSMFQNNHCVITDAIISHSDILQISDEIGNMFRGKTLTINAGGLTKDSLTQKRNGKTLFGFEVEDNIDYVVNMTKKDNSNRILFDIEFDQSKLTYFLNTVKYKASHVFFLHLTQRLYITESKKQIVLGKNLFTFIQDINTGVLIIKKYNKDTKKETSKFFEKKNLVHDISIGMGKIYFCENNDKWYISYYEKKKIWFIDHDFEHNAAMSCWKVIDDKVEIKDVMRIKVCKNVFRISVIKKEDI